MLRFYSLMAYTKGTSPSRGVLIGRSALPRGLLSPGSFSLLVTTSGILEVCTALRSAGPALQVGVGILLHEESYEIREA
jgi:hypothetical protein